MLLGWDAATDDRTPAASLVYEIWIAAAPGTEDFASPPDRTTAGGATAFEVEGLAPATMAWFVARARDEVGNVDANTVELGALPVTDTTPPVFGGVTSATTFSPSRIDLAWDPATDDITPAAQIAYEIYAGPSAGGEDLAAPIASVTGAGGAHVAGLTPTTTYFFVVRARDLASNEETNVMEASATTTATTVSYAAEIQPVWDANCNGPMCHNAFVPAEGLNLTASASLLSLVDHAAAECGGTVDRVAPGDPDNSYLTWKLDGAGPCLTGVAMPKGKPPLPGATLGKIRQWILEGALDD